jgi:copper chaperone NosL
MKDLLFTTLSKKNRLLILGVGVFLVLVYFIPIWSISISAPQYPEGLGMHIWINQITGATPYDLKNINLLNHYIGKQEIISESIPELLFMPYVLAYLIFGALVTELYPKVGMAALGIINLVIVGIVGLFDFWRWEYNYGHNLNPDAPIIIEGMAYQPPLLGCKVMLNITACSYPSYGGMILGLSLVVLVYILWDENRRKKSNVV